jgi:hypothetical protein
LKVASLKVASLTLIGHETNTLQLKTTSDTCRLRNIMLYKRSLLTSELNQEPPHAACPSQTSQTTVLLSHLNLQRSKYIQAEPANQKSQTTTNNSARQSTTEFRKPPNNYPYASNLQEMCWQRPTSSAVHKLLWWTNASLQGTLRPQLTLPWRVSLRTLRTRNNDGG